MFVGTNNYKSPEVRDELDKLDWERSDVFSLGITLLEAATLIKASKFEKNEVERNEFIMKNVTSKYLKYILPKMLKNNFTERITFRELKNEQFNITYSKYGYF